MSAKDRPPKMPAGQGHTAPKQPSAQMKAPAPPSASAPPPVHWNPAARPNVAAQRKPAAPSPSQPPAVHWNPAGQVPVAPVGNTAQMKAAQPPARHHVPPQIRWGANAPKAAISAQHQGDRRLPGTIQPMFQSDFERKVNPNDRIVQVPYQRSQNMGSDTKKSVDRYKDGSDTGVYKHFIPDNWLHKIYEACLSGAKLEVVPSISNSLVGQTVPPKKYIKRGSFRLPIANTEEFNFDSAVQFQTSIDISLRKFTENPYNIFRGDSDGDGGGTKVDIPKTPSTKLKKRLTEFAENLIAQADKYLGYEEKLICDKYDWDDLKDIIGKAVITLNSR
ncbi:hypothetical protein [Magnetospirillum sp. 64-120]|uniref:hypothetical protein n=1 Tax=Magnetospirillum sp. 64-120 TaxID=1895778 RepID=UPI0025C2F3FE|nr:hypothetical protein [Magnetospirillum sp. 64-120]